MGVVVISVDVLAHAISETAKISVPAVIASHQGELSPQYCDEKLRRWAHRLLSYAGAHVVTTGQDLADPDESYVVMSNHLSVYDIPTWFEAIPLSLRMAAKAELFRVPVWGRAMLAAGFVPIDRSRPDAAREALDEAGQRMRAAGLSLCIAPEGTRSPDGRVHRFKRGGFEFARATGFPILPVAISGTECVLGKGQYRVTRGVEISVRILPPIDPPSGPDIEDLRETTRARIEVAVHELSRQRERRLSARASG